MKRLTANTHPESVCFAHEIAARVAAFIVSDILMRRLSCNANVLIVDEWVCEPQSKQQQLVLDNKEENTVPGQRERLIPAGALSWGTVKLEMIKAVLLLDHIRAG